MAERLTEAQRRVLVRIGDIPDGTGFRGARPASEM